MGRAGLVAAAVIALLLAGCGGGDEPSAGPPGVPAMAEGPGPAAWDPGTLTLGTPGGGAWWAASRVSDLEPTGIEVVARSSVRGMAADGTGAAWLVGGGWLARVDPSTGAGRVWDAGDDLAFASVDQVRPTGGAGVWLLSRNRVRLFDGVRFVRDVVIPDRFLGDGAMVDMVQSGDEIWVAGAHGVARCAGGTWTLVDAGALWPARRLTVDGDGVVWVAGFLRGAAQGWGVARYVDGRWRVPATSGEPHFIAELVGDPRGGPLARLGGTVWRLESGQWRRTSVDRGGLDDELEGLADDVTVAPAPTIGVGRESELWVVEPDGLSRYEDGVRRQRVPVSDGVALVAGGSLGGALHVADGVGLLRVEPDRLDRVWSTQVCGAEPGQPATSWGADPGFGCSARAIDAREVWVSTSGGTGAVVRIRDGVRYGVMAAARSPAIQVASDGAVWVLTGQRLTRFVGGSRDMDVEGVGSWDWSLAAGPEGGVWVLPPPGSYWWWYWDPQEFEAPQGLLVRADGSREIVAVPESMWTFVGLVAGADGTVWAWTEDGPSSWRDGADADSGEGGGRLWRWDGRWSPVAHPGEVVLPELLTPDGAMWGALFEEHVPGAAGRREVVRYFGGTWSRHPYLDDLTGAPDGSVCSLGDGHVLACLSPQGQVAQIDVGIGGDLQIGRDGSVWVISGGTVAQLPVTVPL